MSDLKELRRQLDGLVAEQTSLNVAVATARSAHQAALTTAAQWGTPAGLLAHTDKEQEQQQREVYARGRDLGSAEKALLDFEQGPGLNLGNRIIELQRRESEQLRASKSAEYYGALAQFLAAAESLRAQEAEMGKLALAAGSRRAPVSLFGDDWRAFLRDLAEIAPDLLPADNPQRRMVQAERKNMHICRELAANDYNPRGYRPPSDAPREPEQLSPAARFRKMFKGKKTEGIEAA